MNRGRARSDNFTLVPASQLPFKEEWRLIANDLPGGSVLLVVPEVETPLARAARCLIPHLRASGRHTTTIRQRSLPDLTTATGGLSSMMLTE